MKYNFLFLLLLATLSVQAQGLEDLIRLSDNQYLGSARTVGVGSSFGAMGGDYSSVLLNPAGLGDFKRSDFSLGLGYQQNVYRSTFSQGESTPYRRDYSRLGIDYIGYVSSTASDGRRKNSNLSFGFSRQSDYGSNFAASGFSKGSISDFFLLQAGNTPKEELGTFDAKLAYDSGLIYTDNNGVYTSDYKEDDNVSKSYISLQKGGMSEFTVGYGANYYNKLNIGLSVGIPLGSYKHERRYTQNLTDGDFSNNLAYAQTLDTDITGINLKVGAVYRPIKFLRVGAAIHTPTVYTLNEKFKNTMQYSYVTSKESFNGSGETPDGSFKYNITTPWRAILSAGGILKIDDLYGFVNADIEYVGYGSAGFNLTNHSDNIGDANYQAELNASVKDRLSSYTNMRLGAEVGYQFVRVRGGIGLLKTPFSSDDARMEYSFGGGLNFNRFFLDGAFRFYKNASGIHPYFNPNIKNNPLVVNRVYNNLPIFKD